MTKRKFTPFEEGDAPREYVTRSGRQAFVCKRTEDGLSGLLIGTKLGNSAANWNADGSFLSGKVDDLDLCDVPERLNLWVNVYRNEQGLLYTVSEESRELADKFASRDRIACVEIDVPEWEGL